MKKILLLIVVIALAFPATVLAAGGGKFLVGFVPRAFVSVYFVTMADAVKEAAAKNPNVDVQIVAPVDQKGHRGPDQNH